MNAGADFKAVPDHVVHLKTLKKRKPAHLVAGRTSQIHSTSPRLVAAVPKNRWVVSKKA